MKFTSACITLGAAITLFSGVYADKDSLQIANDVTGVRSLVANTLGQNDAPKHSAAPADPHAQAIQDRIAQIQKQHDDDMKKAEADGRVVHYTEYTPSSSFLAEGDQQQQKTKRTLAEDLLKNNAQIKSEAQKKKQETLASKLVTVDPSQEPPQDEAHQGKPHQDIASITHQKLAHIEGTPSGKKNPPSLIEAAPQHHNMVTVHAADALTGQALDNSQ